jgi:uncharacterized protein (TIGR00297 family)
MSRSRRLRRAPPIMRTVTLRSELPRKVVHIGMGAFALGLRWLAPWQALIMASAALILNSFFLHDITRGALLRPEERASRFSRGVVLYPAVLLLTFVVFSSRLELAAGIWALLAVGDGMAALAGLALGGPRLPWNPKKTWSGFVAFVLVGGSACAWAIRWVQRAGILTLGPGLTRDGLLTFGQSDPSGRIGESFLMGGPLGGAGVGGGAGAGPEAEVLFLVIGCFLAATAAASGESLETQVDDNVLVPLIGGAVLWLATLVDPGLAALGAASGASPGAWVTGFAIAAPIALVAYFARAVDRAGAVAGVVLAVVLYVYAVWPGLVMMGGLMVIGTGVTRMGYARKEAAGVAEGRGGRRGIGSVATNSGAGVAFAFLAAATPYSEAFTLAMVAAFSTSLFDTAATEFGQAFGRRHLLVTTWRSVPEGTTGAVSLEGTLAGVCCATALAGAGWAMGLVTGFGSLAVVVGAFAGSTIESFLGGMMGSGSPSDHHLRNLANTVAGAGVAVGLVSLL